MVGIVKSNNTAAGTQNQCSMIVGQNKTLLSIYYINGFIIMSDQFFLHYINIVVDIQIRKNKNAVIVNATCNVYLHNVL